VFPIVLLMNDSKSKTLSSRSNDVVSQDTRSYMKENWGMPEERINNIKKHKAIHVSKLHENETMLKPVWTKVSKTPWSDRQKLCQGYGRRMKNAEPSNDVPASLKSSFVSSFGRTEFIKGTHPQGAGKQRTYILPESSYILPGGSSIVEAAHNARATHEKYTHNVYYSPANEANCKRTYIDHVLIDEKLKKIDWSKSARDDFGHSPPVTTSRNIW